MRTDGGREEGRKEKGKEANNKTGTVEPRCEKLTEGGGDGCCRSQGGKYVTTLRESGSGATVRFKMPVHDVVYYSRACKLETRTNITPKIRRLRRLRKRTSDERRWISPYRRHARNLAGRSVDLAAQNAP